MQKRSERLTKAATIWRCPWTVIRSISPSSYASICRVLTMRERIGREGADLTDLCVSVTS
ncbi:hypothetical protein KY285_013828 [Solanum tuberosum]|nr:hypothetical protein KY285_013828 [Solanum tuberosum]